MESQVTKTKAGENESPGSNGDGNRRRSTAHEANNGKKMDLNSLLAHLKNSVSTDRDIYLDRYILAYREINRFFELLGAVFHFVAKDVHAKILILEAYLASENSAHYRTIQSMVNYERENEILTKTSDPLSGSRTLLRLHRALEFVIEFLSKISSVGDEDKVASYAQDAYNTTLAKHHSWLIRKTANIAMYALPVKSTLMTQTCQQERDHAHDLVDQVVASASFLYSSVQSLYEKENLLDLP